MYSSSKILMALIFIVLVNWKLNAQQVPVKMPVTRILFIFDCSNSMNGDWQSGKKIDIARRIFIRLLDSLKNQPNLELALRMYGHQSPVPPQDCSDTRLEIPFGKNNIDKIKEKLISTKPKGTTPIARSLELCAADFPNDPAARNIVILITDGKEECGGDPCKIALALYSKGIKLKPFIIGIGLDVDIKKAFECLGTYYDAPTEKDFETFFDVILKKASGLTKMQVHLLDIAKKPTETNVTMTLINETSSEIIGNYVHTLNNGINTDTFYLDPVNTYKLIVHTIPEVQVAGIQLKPRINNIIKVNTPQGFLQLQTTDGNVFKDVKCIVNKSGNSKTLHVQNIYEKEKYIVGLYDIEVLTIPRTYFVNIEITQSTLTALNVAKPGLLTLILPSVGFGGIYIKQKNSEPFLVCNLAGKDKLTIQLQPGEYTIVHRPAQTKSMSFSVVKELKVESDKSYNIRMMP